MKPVTPLARALLWGAAWGVWTFGLPLLVLEGCRQAWILRPLGLPDDLDLSWSPGLGTLDTYAARLGLSGDALLHAVLPAGMLLGALVLLTLHLLDPDRAALASWRWSTRSAWPWLLSLPWVGALCLWMFAFDSPWRLEVFAFVAIAVSALPILFSWWVLHPGTVSASTAKPLQPRPAASRQDLFVWIGLAACVWVAESWEAAGFLLAIPLRALEVHWLMQRGRQDSPRDLARSVLRVSVLRSWFGLSLWPLVWLSLLAGPLMAWFVFSNFEVPMLLDVLKRQGAELPGWLGAALSASRFVTAYWWAAAIVLMPAFLIWSSFAEGRLAHLQRQAGVATLQAESPAAPHTAPRHRAPSSLSQDAA